MLRLNLWFVALCALMISGGIASAADPLETTVQGKLTTGVNAIGAETTGTTIEGKGFTWELDFGKNDALAKAAEKLNGQQVVVSGKLNKVPGVEIKERLIFTVKTLKAAATKVELEAYGMKGDTKIEFASEGERTIVDIHCASGIDRCGLKRTGATWPKDVVVRLHLKGLEMFLVAADKNTIECAVPSSGAPNSTCQLMSGKRVGEITAASPYFAQVRLVAAGDKKPKIPLEGGYFEVPLPAQLLADNAKNEIMLQWVDFYRR
ncbi:hypothetical protein ETAA8_23640 [Anatilimnocola aggregata]|uniref:Uncharacterized protein n=1 Tax=Anatilimnocola aggregata TaxID=2528021 RepID=A0A517YAL8_9BACT|nr:hypothetical protein [Anatilimnocola aggregata]QDU27277.1 hypothetical protein ETAA8_23640 [Anatilimnocola aggregata]